MGEFVCLICQRQVKEGFMICCGKCCCWFHGKCVGQFRNRKLDWHCPVCVGHWAGHWQKTSKKSDDMGEQSVSSEVIVAAPFKIAEKAAKGHVFDGAVLSESKRAKVKSPAICKSSEKVEAMYIDSVCAQECVNQHNSSHGAAVCYGNGGQAIENISTVVSPVEVSLKELRTTRDSESLSGNDSSDLDPKDTFKSKTNAVSTNRETDNNDARHETQANKLTFCGDGSTSKDFLMDSLPTGYRYKVESLKENSSQFIGTIKVNIETKEEALKWLKCYEGITLTNFRRMNGKENTPKLVYKKRFRCHSNTRASEPNSKTKEPHKKHCNCPAVLIITVKNKDMPRSQDKFLQDYPCSIYMRNTHNHRIRCADAMRFRRPEEELTEVFIGLFHRGHSPASALTSLKHDLQEKFGLNYYKVVADGARCPNVQWVYSLYYSHFKTVYGAPNGENMLKSLNNFIDEYNAAHKSHCAVIELFNDQILVVLVTPLMKRVLTNLKISGEIMFMDSGGCMDRHNSRVFLMLAPSVAGALPVGVQILSSESEACIQRALEIYKCIIPKMSFAGRGPSVGPKIIMTDDSTAERNALQTTFSHANLLLCLFHTLQAFWRYVWEKKHHVLQQERQHVFHSFKRCAYASQPEKFNSLFEDLLKENVVTANPTLETHLKELRGRANEWALCFRAQILIRGHHTDNYAEGNIRVIKDQILNRTKAFSITQLFDFLSTKFDAYFEGRISEVITKRKSNYTTFRYFIDKKKLEPLSCQKIAKDVYLVKNSEKKSSYLVDTEVELCQCKAGIGGALCKHLYKVVTEFRLSSIQILPFADAKSKMNLHYIMTGMQGNEEFFQSMKIDENEDREGDELDVCNDVESGDQLMVHEESSNSHAGEPATNSNSTGDCIDSDGKDTPSPKEKLENLVPYLLERSKKNPSLVKHVETFVDRVFNECGTDSALEHALATFNRYRGSKPTKQNQIRALSKVRNAGNIPVLSTSRRKMPISGRHSRITGRPPKDFRLDHVYNKHASETSWRNPSSGRAKAPQNLSHCVTMNVPLGRNSNRKM